MADPRDVGEQGSGPVSPAPAGDGSRTAGGRLLVAVGLALGAALLIAITWSVPVGRIWSALLSVDPWILLGVMLIFSSSLWVRGWRWALLFRPDYRVGVGSATAVAAVGLALNAVLPGRAGEAARVAMASRRFRCGWAFAAATVVGERLLDAVTLLLFLGVVLLSLPGPAATSSAKLFGYSVDAAALGGVVRNLAFVCLLLCVLVASLMSERGRGLLLRVLAPFPGLRARVERPLAEIGRGLKAFRSARLVLGGLFRSVLIWLILALATRALAAGVPGIDLDLRQALGLTAISVAATALPSAPGAWGVFEAAGLLGLTVLSVSFEQSTAVAFVLVLHLSHYLPVLLFGAASALVSHVSLGDVRRLTRRRA